MSQESFDCHLKWLVSRQTPTPAETEDEEEEEEEDEEGAGESRQTGFQVLGALPASEFEPAGPLRVNVEELVSAGFNGRCNKPEDTCYSFWVVGGLDVCVTASHSIKHELRFSQVVGKANLTDYDANRHFLVGKTQHMIGGFAKFPKLPPGETADTTARRRGLHSDQMLCIPSSASRPCLSWVTIASSPWLQRFVYPLTYRLALPVFPGGNDMPQYI